VQDVEGALTRFTKEQRRLLSLGAAAQSGQSSAEIALQQYRAGLVTYVNVLSAQTNYLTARDQLEQSRQAYVIDLVSLYKALGGGWSDVDVPRAANSSATSSSAGK
jgi:outer membrane protein TolC